jgi:hypothetical protein
MMRFSVIFMFSPPFPMLSHHSLFQLNCYSIHGAAPPPSANKTNKSLPLPSPFASHVEKAATMSFPLLLIPPFSHRISFQIYCYPLGCAGLLSSVDKASKSLQLLSPTCESCGEGSDSAFSPPSYFSPLFQTFPPIFLFQLNCYPIGCIGCPLSVNKEKKGLLLPSPTCKSHGEGSDGEFLSYFYIFLHHSKHFLTASISIKLLFSWPYQPPYLSQSREQGPATTIPTHESCGEGGDGEFSSCLYFFSTIPNFFSQLLFPV